MVIIIRACVHGLQTITSTQETFIYDFMEILKQMLQNFCRILKKCVLGTICIVISM